MSRLVSRTRLPTVALLSLVALLSPVALLSLVALGACTTPPTSMTVRSESSVPLEPDTVPVITLTLGSSRPAPFLVDTGASVSLVDDAWSAANGLTESRYLVPRRMRGIGWQRTVWSHARVAQVQLGDGATAHDVELALVDLRNLPVPGAEQSRPVGILGADLLRVSVTLFDARRGELRFLAADPIEERLAVLYPQTSWRSVRVEWKDDTPVIALTAADGGNMRMLLDTGAELSVIAARWDRTLGLEADEERAAEIAEIFATRDRAVLRDDLPFRRVTGVSLAGVPLEFSALRVGAERGILGNDVLRHLSFVLDGPGGRLLVAQD